MFFVVLSFFLTILSISIYTSHRIWVTFSKRWAFWKVAVIYAIFSNIYLILFILSRVIGFYLSPNILFIGYIFLGITICMLHSFLFFDILRLIFFILSKATKKSIKVNNLRFGLTAISLGLLSFILGYINSHITRVTEYNISFSKPFSKDVKVVALSDLHIGSDMSVRRLKKEVEIINREEPDLILFVGDVVDHNIKDYTLAHREAFRGLKAKHGVFAANGNHEQFAGSVEEVKSAFNESGFNFLNDSCVYIEELELNILGRESQRRQKGGKGYEKRESLEEIIKECDATKPIILLDHIPHSIEDGKRFADLQISGHTHNGQFFPINIITKFLFPKSYGLLPEGDFSLIVTSGLGLWGPPMRIGTKSEIVKILLSSN